MSEKTTHFGYKTVDVEEKAGKVAEVTGDFTKLTGKAPMGFNDFMTSNAAAFGAQHTAE